MMDRKPRPNVGNMSFNINKNIDVQRKCELDDEASKHVAAFFGRHEPDDESCDEDISYEELASVANSYIELCVRSEEVCKKQKRIITQLHAEKSELLSTISSLNDEVSLLTSKLDDMSKSVRMLNNGTQETLQVGKNVGDVKGIVLNYQSPNKQGKTPVTKFITSQRKYDLTMSRHMSQHPVKHLNPQPRNKKKSSWRCHYCGRHGHIRPYCYRLYGYPLALVQPKVSSKLVQGTKKWKPKEGFSAQTTKATSITIVPVISAQKNKTETSTVKKGTYACK
jgi:hypothetical protein